MKKSKTLICTLLLFVLLLCVFTGCAKTENSKSCEAPQATSSTMQQTTQVRYLLQSHWNYQYCR